MAQDGVTLRLAWDPSPDTNVIGYQIYYGFAPGEYERVGYAAGTTTLTLVDLPGNKTCYLAAVAFTLEGAVSLPSPEISWVLPYVAPPNVAPTLDPLPDLVLPADSAPLQVTLTGLSPGSPSEQQTLTVTVSSSNPELLPDPVVVAGPSPNGTAAISLAPAAGLAGVASILVTVDDGASRSNLFTRTFLATVGSPKVNTLLLEAEQATVVAPMRLVPDARASGSIYVSSPQGGQGNVSFPIQVADSGVYSVWCRVISPDDGTDSFFVSVDGGPEDIYDTSPNTWGKNWQWTQLNGRVLGGPRLLALSPGEHTIAFRCRESGTSLDAIYLTSNPRFVPVQLQVKSLAGASPARQIAFVSPAGMQWQLLASEDLTNWVQVWTSPEAAVARQFTYTDSDQTPSGRRFYRLEQISVAAPAPGPLRLRIAALAGPGEGTQLSFEASAGGRYSLEASEDLRTWLPIWATGAVPARALYAFVDLELTGSGKRFYRLVREN